MIAAPGAPDHEAAGRALAVGVLGPALAFAGLFVAAGISNPAGALAASLAPLALVVALVRPDLAVAALAGLVMINGGALGSELYGVPNLERVLLVVIAVALVMRPGMLRVVGLAPIVVAFGAFAVVRIVSALMAPAGADVVQTAKILAFGALLVLGVAATCSSATALRRAVAVAVAATATVTVFTTLKLAGIGDTWAGLAGDVVLTPEAQARAIINLEPPTIDLERVSGPIGDPNYWAQCQLLMLPAALWLLRDGWRRGARVLGAVAAVLILAGLLQTESRGGALALLLTGGLWLWLQGGVWRRGLVALPIILIAGLAAGGVLARFEAIGGITDPARASDPSITGRASEAIVAVRMFQDHPITGIGPDQYVPRYIAYAPEVGLDEREQREPHNSYLGMAAESGALGLIAFLAMIGTALGCGLAACRRLHARGRAAEARLAAALACGLVGYALTALFLDQAFPQFLWLALGLLAAVYALARGAPAPAAPRGAV